MSPETKPLAPPSLVGGKVYLRPTTAEDIANMYPWFVHCEPQSMSCRPRILPTPAELVESFNKREKSAEEEDFTVCRLKDNVPLGRIRFFGLNTLNRSAELGLLIDPEEQHHGYGTEAMRVLIRYLFKYRGLNKVHAQTAGFNKAAIGLLEKLGFKRDGTLRDHYFYDGSFHPGYVYSLLLYELDW